MKVLTGYLRQTSHHEFYFDLLNSDESVYPIIMGDANVPINQLIALSVTEEAPVTVSGEVPCYSRMEKD